MPNSEATFFYVRKRARVLLWAIAGVAAHAGPAEAGPWNYYDVLSYSQASWPDTSTGFTLLNTYYDGVYASASGLFDIGSPQYHDILFDNHVSLLQFLPQTGTAGVLQYTYTNPAATESGFFGGDVAALKLNVDFSDAGLLVGTSGIHFGDLVLTNFTDIDFGGVPVDVTVLNGLTLRQLLGYANTALGGGPTLAGLSVEVVDAITSTVNIAFDQGNVTTFAQEHLAAPPNAPTSVPEPSSCLLFATGLIALAAARRRRRHNRRASPHAARSSPVRS